MLLRAAGSVSTLPGPSLTAMEMGDMIWAAGPHTRYRRTSAVPPRCGDDRGTTVLLGEDAAGAGLVWTVGDRAVRQTQLHEPVVDADAQPFDDAIALATAGGQVEVIDLSDPGPGQLLDVGSNAAVRHTRMHSSGRRVDVISSDGHTTTHPVRSG